MHLPMLSCVWVTVNKGYDQPVCQPGSSVGLTGPGVILSGFSSS